MQDLSGPYLVQVSEGGCNLERKLGSWHGNTDLVQVSGLKFQVFACINDSFDSLASNVTKLSKIY
jgi:hypothetical protein